MARPERRRWHAVVEVATEVDLPPEVGRPALFALALDGEVHAASQARHREHVELASGGPVLQLGDEVTFRARHLGVPWRLTARVTELTHPSRFVDEQVRGPFRAFRHEHRFDAAGASTVMRDTFAFRLPGGPAGAAAARLIAAPYLRRLLVARAEHLRDLAERGPDLRRPDDAVTVGPHQERGDDVTAAALLVAIGLLAVVAVLAVVAYVAYRSDARQVEARSRRHREAGGRPGDAPDLSPGHGGGSGGGGGGG
jgi:ligand-binding SRPBCC domain-containing protein